MVKYIRCVVHVDEAVSHISPDNKMLKVIRLCSVITPSSSCFWRDSEELYQRCEEWMVKVRLLREENAFTITLVLIEFTFIYLYMLIKGLCASEPLMISNKTRVHYTSHKHTYI